MGKPKSASPRDHSRIRPIPSPVECREATSFAQLIDLARHLANPRPHIEGPEIRRSDVRLAESFVYLAVIIDAFSRRIVGHALDNHLQARLPLAALDMAIAARNPPPGLIHHSDRGVQYACADYAARLDERGFQRSMSRPGNPYDNAKAESFMKTLKAEEVDGKTYLNLEDARRRISAFIDDVYNADRLHSALGYKSPIAFEDDLRKTEAEHRMPVIALSPK
jgi:transposase InsO family protein